jgi:hypothetical protein
VGLNILGLNMEPKNRAFQDGAFLTALVVMQLIETIKREKNNVKGLGVGDAS